MTTRILIHHDRGNTVADIVRAHAPDVTVEICTGYEGLPDALNRFLPDILFTVRFAGTPNFPRQAIRGCRSLKWIAVGGSGVDHLGPMREGVLLTNAAGVGAEVMAEFAMACIYAFAMQLPVFSAQQHAQIWQQVDLKPVAGATLLVVGLGRVGSAVAALARRNGMGVIAIRSHPERTGDVAEVGIAADLPGFVSRADYVVVCLPLTSATRGQIGEAVLDAMKPDAVLVNLSRGGIVDEAALLSQLSTKRLRGAALDVFAQEPLPANHPFWAMPNVIVSPHNAAVFGGWLEQAARHFCENLTRWRSDQPLLNTISGP